MSVKRIITVLVLLVLMPVALAEEPKLDAISLPEKYIIVQEEWPGGVSLLSMEDGEWEEDWTCYKDQLTGVALAIYEACETEFSAGSVYSSNGCWQLSNTVKVETAKNDLKEDICRGCFAFAADHPELFWIRKAIDCSYTYGRSKAEISVGFMAFPASDTMEERESLQEQIDGVLKGILAGTVDMDTLQKLEYMDKWLAANNTYHYDAYLDDSWINRDETPWSVVGALLEGYSPVCESYAKAFQMFCHEIGVPCLQVSGLADGGRHMWTYVKYNEEWYLCDPTWNDPIYFNHESGDESTQEFFMTAARDCHVPNDDFLLPELAEENAINWCVNGHEYRGYLMTEPTCTEPGYNTHTCFRCRYTYTDGYVDPLGHSFTEYVEEEGLLVAHCDRDCGQTDEKLGSPSWRMERGELKGAEYATGCVMIALYDQQDRLIAVKSCEKGEEKTLDGQTVFHFIAPRFDEKELSRASKVLCFNFSECYVPLRAAISVNQEPR